MKRLHVDQLSNAFIEQHPGARSEKEEVERERPACSGHWSRSSIQSQLGWAVGLQLESTRGLSWEGRLRAENKEGVGLDKSLSGMTWQGRRCWGSKKALEAGRLG